MADGTPRPLVNLAVCGDFKQLQLVPELNKVANIGRVYYASRLSTNARKLGLSSSQACNAFLKEYLLQFHARYLHHAMASVFYPLYDRIWLWEVLRAWQPCDVLYAVLQGKALKLLQTAKQQGAAILGHPIVCHPDFYQQQFLIELERLSLSPASFLGDNENTLAEIALCDRIFCLSELVRESFVTAGFPAENIDIIQLPTDLETFVPAHRRETAAPFRVICVAEISPIKGHIYLLDAWRRLAPANAELIFAGTIRREMMPVLDRYKGLFRYVGPLGRSDLVRLYQESSLLVLPSVQDGFGFVVSEALACGLPVIVTEHVGARDIVRSGENGFVVPPRDVAALADAIARVHASIDLQQRLRDGAIASRSSFPTMADTARRLSEACDRAAMGKRAGVANPKVV
jgi:glycosyltransferase involved in cell wall biosynthesis